MDELFRQNQQKLAHISSTPELDTQVLLCAALKKTSSWLYANLQTRPSARQLCAFKRFVNRRANGEPIAYITGRKEFFGCSFLVNKHVLIPRWETELLVEKTAKETLRKKSKAEDQVKKIAIVDVGCGSGCVIITLAKNLARQARRQKLAFFACDISPKAMEVAIKNAKRNRVAHKITFLRSDLLSAFMAKKGGKEYFAGTERLIIAANLPYIPAEKIKNLPTSVKDFEPHGALAAGDSGLELIKKLIQQINLLKKEKKEMTITALLEISPEQKSILEVLLKKHYRTFSCRFHRDTAGNWRIIVLDTQTPR